MDITASCRFVELPDKETSACGDVILTVNYSKMNMNRNGRETLTLYLAEE